MCRCGSKECLRFLLAQLQMDSIAHKTDRRAVRRALENLPSDINIMYNEVMARIEAQNPDDRELAKRVLSWVSYARRPLRTIELQHALAVEEGNTAFGFDALPDEDTMSSVCAGLIRIDAESSVVRLIRTSQIY